MPTIDKSNIRSMKYGAGAQWAGYYNYDLILKECIMQTMETMMGIAAGSQ